MSGIPGYATGAVWHNPDDFEKARRGEPARQANPQNISPEETLGRKVVYGTKVTQEAAIAAVRAPEVSQAERLALTPEIRETATAVAAEPGKRVPTPETVQKTLISIGAFAKMLKSESVEVQRTARESLSALADAEYARAEGPRKMVLDKLAKVGLTQETDHANG